eukprot:Awhi_evm1s11045
MTDLSLKFHDVISRVSPLVIAISIVWCNQFKCSLKSKDAPGLKLVTSPEYCAQTTCQRVIRVCSFCLPVTRRLNLVYAGVDCKALVSLLPKL